jgi:hypothetical protein
MATPYAASPATSETSGTVPAHSSARPAADEDELELGPLRREAPGHRPLRQRSRRHPARPARRLHAGSTVRLLHVKISPPQAGKPRRRLRGRRLGADVIATISADQKSDGSVNRCLRFLARAIRPHDRAHDRGRCPLYVRAQLDTVGLSWTQRDLVQLKAAARETGKTQLTGRFRRWWQVLGSNQRRLSRRFYRPLPLATRATCRAPSRRNGHCEG